MTCGPVDGEPASVASGAGDDEGDQADEDDEGGGDASAVVAFAEQAPAGERTEHDARLAQRGDVADGGVAHGDEHHPVRHQRGDAGDQRPPPEPAEDGDERRPTRPVATPAIEVVHAVAANVAST